MFNKIYVKTKQFIKENRLFLGGIVIGFLLFTIKLPYYIDTPGGLIDVSERIKIEDSYEVKGSLNLAYVLEMKATIPTLIYAYLNPNWDILKKEEVIASNTTIEEMEQQGKLMLQEANQNALYVGFSKAGYDVSFTNSKVYISYVDEEALTDLKIGDRIVKIEDRVITTKEECYNKLKNYNIDDEIEITVSRNNEEILVHAKLQNINNKPAIGVLLAEIKNVHVPKEVTTSFKSSESGPSGGFMMSLAIYNYLTEKDITNGLKIVGTGTIDMDGTVGSIGGIEYKIKAAVKKKADIFFAPAANYDDALKVVTNNNYNIKLVKISNIDEAIEYLNNISD